MSVHPSAPVSDETNEQGEAQAPAPDMSRSSRRTRKSASAFRTISEVADGLEVQQHVLRFWETKFSQVRPLKRGGGRRYYRPEDVALLQSIHHLLYTEGYTIKGVQKLLKEQGKNSVVQNNAPAAVAAAAAASASSVSSDASVVAPTSAPSAEMSGRNKSMLEDVLSVLKGLKSYMFSEE